MVHAMGPVVLWRSWNYQREQEAGACTLQPAQGQKLHFQMDFFMFPGELLEGGRQEGLETFVVLLAFLLVLNISSEAFRSICGLYEDGNFLLTPAKLNPCSQRLGQQ